MKKRFSVMARTDDGEWMNIYTDQRNFANKQTAIKHLKSFLFNRNYEAEIFTVDVKTEAETIEDLKKDLDRATTIASEVLIRIGYQDSNEQDRIHDSQYNEIHDIRDKYKLDEV